MQTVILILGVVILAIIADGDVRTRRIPNVLSLAVAILGLLRVILVDDPVSASYTLSAAVAIFIAAFLLFWHGAIGGGDAKLLTATVLLIGYHDVFSFLFLMSLCGGTLALAILVQDNLRRRSRRLLGNARIRSEAETVECEAALARSSVPYGVAIAAAAIITLVFETSLAR